MLLSRVLLTRHCAQTHQHHQSLQHQTRPRPQNRRVPHRRPHLKLSLIWIKLLLSGGLHLKTFSLIWKLSKEGSWSHVRHKQPGHLQLQINKSSIMKNSWEYIKIFNQNNLYTLKADSLLLTALWFFICRVSTWQCSLVSPGSLHQPSVYLQWWQHGKSNAWLANYTARENRPV